MAFVLKGAPVANSILDAARARMDALFAIGVKPSIAIVRVGEKADDMAYERGIIKKCASANVEARSVVLPGDCPENRLVNVLHGINADPSVHGAMLFRPLPAHMDGDRVRNVMAPEKDVDGITDRSLAGVFTGGGMGYPSCPAQACMEILKYYGIDPRGKRAVVVGRSLVAGRPVAMLLLGGDATVTICHTRTADIPGICREAEILAVSAGRAAIIGRGCLSPGQIVIDIGVNVMKDGTIRGDVDYEEALGVVGAITPSPGGVGSVTTSVLLAHVVEAAEKVSGISRV